MLMRMLMLWALLFAGQVHAESLTIAAAADLKFAMDDIVVQFKKANPSATVVVTYGSSGNFNTQIQQGAPFDVYFSADIVYPNQLAKMGYATSPVIPYAIGRIVLWSASLDATQLTLVKLTDPAIKRIAIANPKHAPYGKRAEEALRNAGVWAQVESKLIFGENIAQATQFVESGNAQVGIIALSLARNTEIAQKGGYTLIDDRLHTPLEQGFMLTQHAKNNALAQQFVAFMRQPLVRAIMQKYGFILPTEKP
jgi:molybdate transport system substrate-binding protein